MIKRTYQYLKDIYQNYSLKKKLYVVFIAGVFFYLLIFLLYIEILYNVSLKQNYIKDKERIVAEFTDNLSSEMNIVNNMTISMMKDVQIREYLQAERPSHSQASSAKTELYQFINTDNYIESVYLIHLTGDTISINYVGSDAKRQNAFSEEWKKHLEDRKGKAVISLNGNQAFLNGSYPVLSHMRAVYDLDTQKLAGYLVVNISMNLFDEKIQQLWDNGDAYIGVMDKDSRALAETGDKKAADLCIEKLNGQESGSDISTNIKKYAVVSRQIMDWGISVLYIGRVNLLKIMSVNLLMLAAVMFVLTIILLFILRKVMTRTITDPITILAEYMERTKNGYLYRANLHTNNDEIGMLKDTYNRMIVQINELITKLVDEERQKNKLELDVLQEQINPHFLYNTLSSIEYLALSEDNMGAYHALQTLGNFYKNFLGSGSGMIVLKQELDIVRDYIALQKLRFHNIVQLKVQWDESLAAVKVLRLILQPLVENSLVHGIFPKGEEGNIIVTVSKVTDQIAIEIYDDGVGMEQQYLSEMLNGIFHSDTGREEKHFGLRGTLLRIHYYYNIDNFYDIVSVPGQYTRITLYLPVKY